MPQAFSYVRFSHEQQALGDSLRRQLKLADDYAAKHGLTLNNTSYRDLGISAFKGKNATEGALAAFLQAVDVGVIPPGSYLLLEGFDRLSRNQVDEALALFLGIISKGIVVVTLSDGVVYSKASIKDNWTKLVGALAVMARANEESATKSRRVKEAWAQKRDKREPTKNCPSWLQVNAACTGYVHVAEKVKAVRLIFKLAMEGNGIYLVYKHLSEKGIPQLGNAKDGWTVQSVARVLHNQAVIGKLVSLKNGTVHDDYYPAIIDRDVYYAVQEKITERHSVGRGRKGENIANLFSGLLHCGDCGSTMRFLRIPTGDGSKQNGYIECLNSYHSKGCDAKRINYEPLENSLLNYLLVDRHIEVRTDEPSMADPSIAIRAEIADKAAQIERIMDLMETEGERESKNLRGRLSKREDELAALEERLRNFIIPQPAESVFAEAEQAFDDHRRLQETPGPELREARLRLQSVVKQFVERIDLPSKIVLEKNNKILGHVRYREALVLWRGRWSMLLTKRDLERDGRERKLITEAVLAYGEKNREPWSVMYRVPKVGGARTFVRKSKKAPEEAILE